MTIPNDRQAKRRYPAACEVVVRNPDCPVLPKRQYWDNDMVQCILTASAPQEKQPCYRLSSQEIFSYSCWHEVTSLPPSPRLVLRLQDEHGVETQPTRMAAHAGDGSEGKLCPKQHAKNSRKVGERYFVVSSLKVNTSRSPFANNPIIWQRYVSASSKTQCEKLSQIP